MNSMEIEILTTKKKLSKSIIKQMKPADISDMNYFLTMPSNGFFVRNIDKNLGDVLIFEGINTWCVISRLDYSTSIHDRKLMVDNGYRSFESKEKRDKWLESYNKVKHLCIRNHLYI